MTTCIHPTIRAIKLPNSHKNVSNGRKSFCVGGKMAIAPHFLPMLEYYTPESNQRSLRSLQGNFYPPRACQATFFVNNEKASQRLAALCLCASVVKKALPPTPVRVHGSHRRDCHDILDIVARLQAKARAAGSPRRVFELFMSLWYI